MTPQGRLVACGFGVARGSSTVGGAASTIIGAGSGSAQRRSRRPTGTTTTGRGDVDRLARWPTHRVSPPYSAAEIDRHALGRQWATSRSICETASCRAGVGGAGQVRAVAAGSRRSSACTSCPARPPRTPARRPGTRPRPPPARRSVPSSPAVIESAQQPLARLVASGPTPRCTRSRPAAGRPAACAARGTAPRPAGRPRSGRASRRRAGSTACRWPPPASPRRRQRRR